MALMDVKLPGMDGPATFRKVKQLASQVLVIMVTGYSVEDIIEQAKKEGAIVLSH